MTNFQIGNVPCNGCTRCCQGDAVRLLPDDDPWQYQVEDHPAMPGQLMLAHKPDGSCIYLGSSGCTIHGRAPQQCRQMDCRVIAMRLTYTQVRKMKAFPIQVWQRGRELLRETA